MNRQIRDFERPHPEEVRNNKLVVGQFVPMSVVTLIAGTLAGISASLFVYDGHLRWPSSQVPLALFGFAIFVAEFGGIAIASYVSRPTQSWVEDSSVFRSWLRRERRAKKTITVLTFQLLSPILRYVEHEDSRPI
jgi:hypothetical protein